MTIVRAALLGLAGAAFVSALPAAAHHSYAMFDREKETTVQGTVKKWHWTNPHSWLYVVAPGPDGAANAEWAIETGSLANLSRIPGWTRTMMKPGDQVTVIVNPTRDGSAGGNLVSVTLANGETVSLRMGDRRGGPNAGAPAAAAAPQQQRATN